MAVSTSCYPTVRNPFLPTVIRIYRANNYFRRNLSLPSITCRSSSTALSEREGDDDAHIFSVTPSNKSDIDYLGQSTKGDLNLNFGIDGQVALEGPIEEVARMEAQEAEDLLTHLGIPGPFSARYSHRGIFCSRTLNLRCISAIGYDMDYTLMHYNVMVITPSCSLTVKF